MIQEEDLSICHTCMNRLYNANSDLLCAKKLDNSNIQFFCSGFSSEEVYEDKEFLIKEDKAENSQKKILNVFIWLVLVQLVGMAQILFSDTSDLTLSIIVIVCTFISIGVFFALYNGKRWAKRITNNLYLVSLLAQLVDLGSNVEDPFEILKNAFWVLLTLYILYFINFDKDFVRHFEQYNS